MNPPCRPSQNKPTGPSGGRAGWHWLARFRGVAQVGIWLLVISPLWWRHLWGGADIYQGNFAAAQLRLGGWTFPMADPFTAVSVLFSSANLPWTLAGGALLMGGGYALVRARIFCALACPIHLVLEMGDRVLVRTGWRREKIGAGWPWWMSLALAGAFVLAAAVFRVPVFEPANPINALVRAFQNCAWAGLGWVGAVVLLEVLAGRRVFCRHLCPIGGFYGAFNQVGVAGVAVVAESCTGCLQCASFCLAAPELESAIAEAGAPGATGKRSVESPHCTFCLDCLRHCNCQGIVVHRRWGDGASAPSSPPVLT